jgi:hypothetical protein
MSDRHASTDHEHRVVCLGGAAARTVVVWTLSSVGDNGCSWGLVTGHRLADAELLCREGRHIPACHANGALSKKS